jgi:tetratricopeptide (TPR) repeat protein
MSRRQTLVIIVGFFAFLWGAGLTLYFGADMGAGRVANVKSPQRFTAKEGTTRENARALVSSAREEGLDEFERAEKDLPPNTPQGADLIGAQSISKTQATFRRDMATSILDRIAEEETPEARAEALENALGVPKDAGVEAVLRMELGTLYEAGAALSPEKALTEYRRVMDVAGDAEVKLDAAQRAAALTRRLGRSEEAQAILTSALDATVLERRAAIPGAQALKSMVMLGDVAREMGETELAERAYADAVEAGLRAETADAGVREVFRLAGMRLVRLLRELGRDEDAEHMGRRVQGRLLAMGVEH